MSIILQPITTNYLFQTLGTYLTINSDELTKGINPTSRIIRKLQNSNYYDYKKNDFKYMFVYNFTLDDFVNCNAERAEVIAVDTIRLNFYTDLLLPNGKTITLDYIRGNPELANKYSIQYGKNGIQQITYVNELIDITLPQILSQCPINMKSTNEFNPEYYLTKYDFVALDGKTTQKVSNVAVIKYTTKVDGKPVQKVILFGTGLEEIYV
jgi:hypothetical protein